MTTTNPASIIKKSFAISFILLICIISTYQSIIFIQTLTGNSDANKVNIAGRQRMLSQRISKNLLLSISATTITERDGFIDLAASDIETLEKNHFKLEESSDTSLLSHDNIIKNALLKIKQPLNLMIASVKATEAIDLFFLKLL